MSQNILFLDLEETVINEWCRHPVFLRNNINKIKDMFFSRGENLALGIMSWAMWNDEDKAIFNAEIRPTLEDLLGMKFSDEFVWSMDDWARKLLIFNKKKISREDLFDIFGKEEVLFMLSKTCTDFTGKNIFLVDDAVQDGLQFQSFENKCIGTIIKIGGK